MANMLQIVLENLLSKPATRNFPAEQRPLVDDYRGEITFEMSKCTYCTLCATKCPANAIEVDRKEKTLKFNLFRCVSCGACVDACKQGCAQLKQAYAKPAYNKPGFQLQIAPAGVVETSVAAEKPAEAAPVVVTEPQHAVTEEPKPEE